MKNKEKTREILGIKVSIVGILLNVLLAVGKIVLGAIFGMISVLADGLNNLTDCGSSCVSLVSFKLSSKPADKEHPYGHERVEYISSMIVAFVILIIAFELIKESILKIISPQVLEYSFWLMLFLIVSILIKLVMYFYYKINSKKINSDILKASAIDSLSDCLSTSVVLISICVGLIFNISIDGFAGILVAIFIIFAGLKIIKEMVSKLIGQAPDKKFFEEIKERILKNDNVLGIHDLNVYTYGPNKYFGSVHIEIDASIDVLLAHEIIDDIERDFMKNTNIVLTAHHDPIVRDDEEVNFMREKISEMVLTINNEFQMHDFRMVKGLNKTNIIFEVAIPFDTDLKDEEIKNNLNLMIENLDNKYRAIIIVEKQMIL